MKPQSAKAKSLKPLNKYRQAKTPQEYLNQRFIINLDNDCWEFTGAVDRDGYGQVHHARSAKDLGVTRAHQMAWVVHSGASIPKGMLVCHTCDNPRCINPAHLFLGSNNDNVQDMMKKGRYKNPYTHYGAINKLSNKDKEIILGLYGKNTCFEVAKLFDISFSRVCQIWRGE